MTRLLTVKEAADVLGVTPQTLRNWEARGELVPYRNPVNNYRMYSNSHLEKFLQRMAKERFHKGKFRIEIVPAED